MNALAKTLRLIPATNRIERMPLSKCLHAFGLPAERAVEQKGFYVHRHTRTTFNLGKMNEWELKDLLHLAQKWWLAGCKRIQTQFVENHETAARWNALWQRIVFLFNRKGITE